MDLILLSIGVIVVSVIIIGGAFYFFKNKTFSSVQSQQKEIESKIKDEEKALASIVESSSSYASRAQLSFLQKQIEDIKSELIKEKEALSNIEKKLDAAQTSVEEKEAHQQDLRSRSEDDEEAYEELAQNYKTLSEQSVALEQKLASSLKRIDALKDDGQLSEDEAGALSDLSEVITQAGARLRDLLMEYQTLSDRLTALKKQHNDLEEEYTKLVERQLGI